MGIDFSLAIQQIEDMVNNFINLIPNILIGLIVLFMSYYLAKGIQVIVRRLSRLREYPENLALVLGRLSRAFTLVMGFLIALLIMFPDFNIGELIQMLGIGGVIAGLAFRDIFQDFLAGILLLLTEPFNVGDQIIVDDFEGTIEEIQTRATYIKTYDSRRVVIPNADMFTNSVIVNTAYDARRIEYDIGIGYGDDVAAATRVILNAIQAIPGILKDPPPQVLVRELADFSVVLRVRWWIAPPRRYDAVDSRDKILAHVKHELLAHGIDLPFPTQQVLFHDQTEETDGDRARQREGWPIGQRDTAPKPYRIADVVGRLQLRSK